MSSRLQPLRKADWANWAQIYETVRNIPYGRVATYAQVARLTGQQCTAQIVGHALASLEADTDVPGHRVINAQGKISPRAGIGAELQRQRLLQEGIRFDEQGRVDFKRYGFVSGSRSDPDRLPSSVSVHTTPPQQPGTSQDTALSSHPDARPTQPSVRKRRVAVAVACIATLLATAIPITVNRLSTSQSLPTPREASLPRPRQSLPSCPSLRRHLLP